MAHCTIHPIALLETRIDKSLMTYRLNFGQPISSISLTHLHHDHVAEAFRFPKAKFLVQKIELEFAQKPHPSVAAQYNRKFVDTHGQSPWNSALRVIRWD
jgi:glyoxylase-like metal-dependent hydrolase (beta-lactamase superfamily II)